MNPNSFNAKATLTVGERDYEIFRLDALQAKYDIGPAAVLAQGPAREPAAQRGRRVDPGRRTSRRWRRWDAEAEPAIGDRVHAGARADAGLHRRARGRRPGRDARRDARDGRRPAQDQPAACRSSSSSTTRSRSTCSARAAAFAPQRRARVRAQPGALRVPAVGPGRVRRTSRSSRPTRGSCHQVNLEYLARVVVRRRRATASATPTRSSAPTRTRR